MEQITKVSGCFYYGKSVCESVDDAYSKFRKDYHQSLGKNVAARLNRLGSRKERVHGYGIDFAEPKESSVILEKKVPVYLMGIVADGYCRMLGMHNAPDLEEEEYEQWLDFAFSRNSGVLRTVGVKFKAGRTSKLINKKYR